MQTRSFSSFNKKGGAKFKKIDYKKKEFKNPFFQSKKRRFSRPDFSSIFSLVKSRLTIIIIGAIILTGFYFIFFSSILEIKNINLNGLARTNKDDLTLLVNNQKNEKKLFIFKQSNLLIFNKKDLIKNLEDKYDFASIEIKKDFLNTLNIEIQEKSLSLVWLEEGRYYNTDIDGYIISEVNTLDIKKNAYPIIENRREKLIENNQIKFNKEEVEYSIKLFSIFAEKVQNIKMEKFILDNDIDTVKVKAVDGPEIYFDINQEPDKQINKSIIIKEEKLKDDFSKKTYIDLRYGDRVYYR